MIVLVTLWTRFVWNHFTYKYYMFSRNSLHCHRHHRHHYSCTF